MNLCAYNLQLQITKETCAYKACAYVQTAGRRRLEDSGQGDGGCLAKDIFISVLAKYFTHTQNHPPQGVVGMCHPSAGLAVLPRGKKS